MTALKQAPKHRIPFGREDGEWTQARDAQLRWDANSPAERHAASLTVVLGGRDVAERRLFLAMLGLLP